MTSALTHTMAVSLQSVRRTFGDHVAVESLDLDIAEGEFFSIIGPSGCGKTTTLRMLAGLDQPSAGTIEIHDKDVTGVPAYKRPVHTVFQSYALFPHLDVAANVGFGLREQRVSKAELRSRVGKALELVAMADFADRRPAQLSGGMQQRVALARALVLNPEVLLLDEPLGALDLKLRRQLQIMLKELQREVGITFVYVTHDQEEAFSMSDRVGIMNQGRLVQVAKPSELYERPANRFVADFVGSSNLFPVNVQAPQGSGYQVSIAGQQLVVPGVDGIAGREVEGVAVLRPEKVQWAGDAPIDVTVHGTVKDESYVGSHSLITMMTTAFNEVLLSCPSRFLPSDLRVGREFEIGWNAADLWVVTE